MRLLYVEDEGDFALQVKKAIEAGSKISVDSDEFILDQHIHHGGGNSTEIQLARLIEERERVGGEYDAVLIDTDLSGLKNAISQSAIRSACSMIGLPVLRYSKAASPTASDRLKYLATISREGSQALQVPVQVLTDGLAEWLTGILTSFKEIRRAIKASQEKQVGFSPQEIFASMLDEPDIDLDLLGYSGANFIFFGELVNSKSEKVNQPRERNYSTQLGYWLANYILMFPGPILNEGATAAYLGISRAELSNDSIRKLLADAKYNGPFAEASTTGCYYIRRRLDRLILESDVESFAELCAKYEIHIANADGSMRWYYCIVNDEPILEEDAVGPFDWIPRGADICRIKKSTYEQLAPWLGM